MGAVRARLLLGRGGRRRRAELAEALRHFFVAAALSRAFGNVTRVDYDRHDLAPTETTDPVGNIVRAELDYRVLSPRLVDRPQRQPLRGRFRRARPGRRHRRDGQGRREPRRFAGRVRARSHRLASGGLLRRSARPRLAPARQCDDPHRLRCRSLFRVAKTGLRGNDRARDACSDLRPGERSKTQIGLHYSDGFGREIQTKMQAEPARSSRAAPISRRAGSAAAGRSSTTRASPVRQYEPFFTASHDFEFAAIRGVSPILFYDPVERVVATLHPDKTFEKVVFDPWRQTSWDVNDTVTADPASRSGCRRLFPASPRQRLSADLVPAGGSTAAWGRPSRAAAEKAAAPCRHAGRRLFRHARPDLSRHRRQRRRSASTGRARCSTSKATAAPSSMRSIAW